MSTRTTAILATVVVGLAVLVGVFVLARRSSGGPPEISVSDVFASETAGSSSALYMTIDNEGGGDHLKAVIVSGIGQVTLHDANMAPQPSVSVKGHGTTRLAPGSTHVMLENPSNALKPGMQVGVRLLFDKSAPIDTTADVLSYDDINAKVGA